jgi:hypothetical protein
VGFCSRYSKPAPTMMPSCSIIHEYPSVTNGATTPGEAVSTDIVDYMRSRRQVPNAAATRALHSRDGWRCRYCGCRVVSKSARDKMRAALPGAIPWRKSEGYHAAFLALLATVEHVTPSSNGGDINSQNLVTACWPCQFGRCNYSLDELGLVDPRSRAPIVDDWDGLCRILRPRG